MYLFDIYFLILLFCYGAFLKYHNWKFISENKKLWMEELGVLLVNWN